MLVSAEKNGDVCVNITLFGIGGLACHFLLSIKIKGPEAELESVTDPKNPKWLGSPVSGGPGDRCRMCLQDENVAQLPPKGLRVEPC